MSIRGAVTGALRTRAGQMAALVFIALIGLGVWQIQRLAWKTDLIARIDARLAAAPVPPPSEAAFSDMETPEYLRVALVGRYIADGPDAVPLQTLVQALTVQGRGYWVMAPFLSNDGQFILINRGFLPETMKDAVPPVPEGQQNLSGLLRLSQPGGAFLRSNDPGAGRWFSRDVKAIGAVLGTPLAPWFLDLGQPGEVVPEGVYPVPGLTVVRLRNSHLGYAITWFSLAVVWVIGVGAVLRARDPDA
ncbi:SURF1 family protein [Xinfangfangia sp. D13-10-4-6]|uniref:SURF1 family protein n=1 Tax=Pseudogemmobacter hezensis TaxID=2737662 RepID=UPI0015528BCB|nr:SURF1 family protein [Pseudogemmobacter hezensis]NPD16031.1 SURF1 family protein [Pseudogemmobacter hezensis]